MLTKRKYPWTETFLTETDLERIEIALRLRVEACEDNKEIKEAANWERTHFKVIKSLIVVADAKKKAKKK